MPLPERSSDETHEQFIDRCMANPTMIEEFPDAAQRRAVCEGQAKPAKGEASDSAVGQDGGQIRPGEITMTATMQIEAAAAGTDGKPKLPRFTMVAYTGGDMRLMGWKYPVVVDLGGMTIARQNLVIRAAHQERVGHAERVVVENGNLIAAGVISCTGQVAKEVVADAKNGFPWEASIGASVDQFEFVNEEKSVLVNGREFNGPVNVVRKSTLREISFVDIGADGNTSVSVAAKAKQDKEPIMADEKVKQTDADIEAKGTGGGPQRRDVDAIIQRRREENERIDQITAIIAEAADVRGADLDALNTISAKAIEEHWAVKDLELAVLRLAKAPVLLPDNRIGGGDRRPMVTARLLETAALMATGYNEARLVKSMGEQTVEQAEKRFGRTIGLQEMILAAAKANGYSGRERITEGNWYDVIGWASPGRRVEAAGFSTVDLTGILGSVANKALAAVAGEPVWLAPKLAGVASHTNFHTHTIYSMAMNGELEPVGPTGELHHLAFAEENYTRQVGTRGAILRLSRTDVINDDLGVFTRNAAGLARKAYTTREKALLTAIMASGAGASHFTAAHVNYITGATTLLGPAGMAQAIAAFRKLKGPDGDPIMVEPAILLIPPTLEDVGRRLLAAGSNQIMVDHVAGGTVMGTDANIYAGRFGGAPLVSPWLEVTTITGNSVAYWYLLADPNIYPCYEIAYLNGNQTPTVQYFGLEADADVLGLTWRIFWDFGVGAAEWRAGVKSAGA